MPDSSEGANRVGIGRKLSGALRRTRQAIDSHASQGNESVCCGDCQAGGQAGELTPVSDRRRTQPGSFAAPACNAEGCLFGVSRMSLSARPECIGS